MEYAIVFLPLIGSIISGFFGKKIGDRYSQFLTSFLVAISGLLSLFIFYEVLINNYSSNKIIFNWITPDPITPGINNLKNFRNLSFNSGNFNLGL